MIKHNEIKHLTQELAEREGLGVTPIHPNKINQLASFRLPCVLGVCTSDHPGVKPSLTCQSPPFSWGRGFQVKNFAYMGDRAM